MSSLASFRVLFTFLKPHVPNLFESRHSGVQVFIVRSPISPSRLPFPTRSAHEQRWCILRQTANTTLQCVHCLSQPSHDLRAPIDLHLFRRRRVHPSARSEAWRARWEWWKTQPTCTPHGKDLHETLQQRPFRLHLDKRVPFHSSGRAPLINIAISKVLGPHPKVVIIDYFSLGLMHFSHHIITHHYFEPVPSYGPFFHFLMFAPARQRHVQID